MTELELVRLAFDEAQPSDGFVEWLKCSGVSIAFTKGNSLVLIGLRDDGELSIVERQYGACMALAAPTVDTLVLASRYQIWLLQDGLSGALTADGHDRLYLPQTAWTTGGLRVRDLTVDASGRVVFVNGLCSCLCATSERMSFEPLWLAPFVSAIVPEDRCGLSGVAPRDGVPAYVTCFAVSDTKSGWSERQSDGGVVVSIAGGTVLARGLSLPSSPRLDPGGKGDRLWLANGGAGELGVVDLRDGGYRPVAQLPGLSRGLALHEGFAVVGVSRPQRGETFAHLPMHARQSKSGEPRVGLVVVDLGSGEVAHSLLFEGGTPEIQAVAVLPGVRSPTAITFNGDDAQELVAVPRAAAC